MILFLTALTAFVGGALVSWANYLLLKLLIKRKGEQGAALISPVRTLLSVAYLMVLFLIGRRTGLNSTVLLVGGALGLTVMLTVFTFRITREAKEQRKE